MFTDEYSIFPEKEVIYSGFWRRFAASFIDGLILLIPNYIVQRVVGGTQIYREVFIDHEFVNTSILGILITYIIAWLYSALQESSAAQATVGKQALGIKVTNMHNERISFGQATGRHFAKYLSAMIIFIGYIMMVFDDRKQTLHDKLAGTLVVMK